MYIQDILYKRFICVWGKGNKNGNQTQNYHYSVSFYILNGARMEKVMLEYPYLFAACVCYVWTAYPNWVFSFIRKTGFLMFPTSRDSSFICSSYCVVIVMFRQFERIEGEEI